MDGKNPRNKLAAVLAVGCVVLFMLMQTPMLMIPTLMNSTIAVLSSVDDSGSSNGTASCSPVINAGDSGSTTPGGGIASNSVASYTAKYGQAAFNIGKQYGIPYEVILGQSAIESGWGQSRLTVQAFNFFGIKATAGEPYVEMVTHEYGAGGRYETTAKFVKYSSADEGFAGYGKFIHKNERYAKALQHPQDPYGYIVELKEAGYATDPNYVDTVWGQTQSFIRYIQEQGLFPPSSEVTPDVAPPATDGSGTVTNASCNTGTGATSGEVGKVGGAPTVAKSDFSWMCDTMHVCKAGDYGDIASGAYGYQCVWYAWTRLAMIHGYEGWTRVRGDGGEIWSKLQGQPGWTVDQTPHPGDGVSATHAQAPAFAGTTHVAVVEEVQDDPSGWKIRVSEGNMHQGASAAPCFYASTKGCWQSYSGSRWLTQAQIGGVHFFRNAAWKN